MSMGDAVSESRKRVVVVGNGMVSHRLCQSLLERDRDRSFEICVIGEEVHPAYDRVHLSEYFSGRRGEQLLLANEAWYRRSGIELVLGDPVVELRPSERWVRTRGGRMIRYDDAVLATGSSPFVPPIPGIGSPRVLVYRTIEDLERIEAAGRKARRAAVIGGGLLGLEAAKALVDMGLQTTVIEAAPRLMPRQVDAQGGVVLARSIESLGVEILLEAKTSEIIERDSSVGIVFADGFGIDVDFVVVSAGIRPRDELADVAGLARGARGGFAVDGELRTSAPRVFAIGECASHRDFVYGLVGPGYSMADCVASILCGEARRFEATDPSTKLKLLGVDVASFGEPFADDVTCGSPGSHGPGVEAVVYLDARKKVYQKLLVSTGDAPRLVGGILVGDCTPYPALRALSQSGKSLGLEPRELLFGAGEPIELGDEAQLCSCNDVSYGAAREVIRERKLSTVGEVKACSRAGTGCGGCVPVLSKLLSDELARAGRVVDRNLCEHFPFSRQELFQIVKIGRLESFEAILARHGRGGGCEVCRPAVASILASSWNDPILRHESIQDTNDRFLANVQRGGTYSVVPRIPGGEITPEKLIVLGRVAQRFGLYCKITGGQRIDLLGARVEELPRIWSELVGAGFESGHAYGKAMRTVKSCVGSTWCRFGVQDSTSFAIRVEERYRGIRAPHKLKAAVSGCIRECAEAQSKDFGLIATERGWNLYVGGNGGSNPRHAELLATDLSEDEALRLIDRFLMYYIHTAEPLERTARWLERLEGGLAYLKSVIVDDALGIVEDLDRDMAALVASYRCEWRGVVENPKRWECFRHFANSEEGDDRIEFVEERGQSRPADWGDGLPEASSDGGSPEDRWSWVRIGGKELLPIDSGRAFRVPGGQVAVFHVAFEDRYYATENRCPHQKDMVLARGLVGSRGEEPKVACPLHKKTFSLVTGKGLSDPGFCVRTFPIEIREDGVYLELPPAEEWSREAAVVASAADGGCR